MRFRHGFAMTLVIVLLVSMIGASGAINKSVQGIYHHILDSQIDTQVNTSTWPALSAPEVLTLNPTTSIVYYNLNLTSTDDPKATGLIGPNLTHFGSRSLIAGGVLPNDPADLAKWLANPQDVKPGIDMPNLGLSSDQINALVAYLESLK